MKVKAYAKVNLALDVIRIREDGYHDLKMIMAPITLHDLIYITKQKEGITIESNNKRMPTNEKNIMYKVAQRLIDDYGLDSGVHIHIYKHIPTQAGLGGGSADGAAVLKSMNTLFHLNLTLEELAHIGKDIGADIPFCLYNQISVVEGIGEKIQVIDNDFKCYLLLVKPYKGISTKKAFTMLDVEHIIHPDIQGMKEGIECNNYQQVIQSLGNSLEAPSIAMVDDIRKIKETMLELGFDGALMSGSGSCVFGMTKDLKLLEKGYKIFKEQRFYVRKTEILTDE